MGGSPMGDQEKAIYNIEEYPLFLDIHWNF